MAKGVRVLALMLASSAVCLPAWLEAMEIQKFDKMANADQDEYVADLVIGAQKVLREDGRAEDAAKVHKLFTEKDPQGEASTGMLQFDLLLDRARVADLDRIRKDPNADRLEVEHAMILTLKKNGIILPKSFMTVMKDFKPKFPPKKK